MTDDKAQQLVDRNRIFLELQQLTIDEYKIKQRILQEGEFPETLGEGEEFAKLRRQLATEKDVKKATRDLLVLQESNAHAVAYLLAKNNEWPERGFVGTEPESTRPVVEHAINAVGLELQRVAPQLY